MIYTNELDLVALKVFTFLIALGACLSMLTGIMFVITQMTFWSSITTALVPSMLFAMWCSAIVKEDYRDM